MFKFTHCNIKIPENQINGWSKFFETVSAADSSEYFLVPVFFLSHGFLLEIRFNHQSLGLIRQADFWLSCWVQNRVLATQIPNFVQQINNLNRLIGCFRSDYPWESACLGLIINSINRTSTFDNQLGAVKFCLL